MKITVATMDRAIRKIEFDLDVDYRYEQGACEGQVLEAIRQGYLRGFADAAKVEDPHRDKDRKNGITKVLPHTTNAWDNGHDAHAAAIRTLIRAIKKGSVKR